MKQFIAFIAACSLFISMLAIANPASPSSPIKVTVLGSANVAISPDQFGPSILVQAGGQTFLFDAGRGVPIRIKQAGVAFADVDKVFLTHLHSDHVVGLPDLWMMGWMAGRQEVPLNIWGPKGTNNMVSHLQQAFSYDTHIRQVDMHLDPRGAMMKANEVEEGIIFEKSGVVVRAIRVDHGKVKEAFGYRLDYQGYSVALSGDTRKNDNLANKAKGVDVMFHAVMAPRFYGADKHPIIYDKVRVRHTIPKEAGQIFAAIDPRLAVIYHRNDEPAAEVELLRDTRAQFRGDLRLAEDLMVIEIGKELKIKGGLR